MPTTAHTPPTYEPGRQPTPAPAAPPAADDRSPWHRMVDHEIEMLDAIARAAPPRHRASATTAVAEAAAGRDRSIKHEYVTRPRRDLFGLALSGGGIRSATFNLGLLQGLRDLGILSIFDYLSTVSGGGYLGAFWSAWIARKPAERGGDFPTVAATSRAECAEVEHLRRFSNFLSPRVGLLSYDTGRMVVALLGGMLPAFLASTAVMLGALYAWAIVAQLLFLTSQRTAAIALFVIATTFLVVSEFRWRERDEPGNWLRYTRATALGVAATVATWWWMLPAVVAPRALPFSLGITDGASLDVWLARLPIVGIDPSVQWLVLLAPAAALGTGALVLLAWRVVVSRFRSALGAWPTPNAASRAASRLIFLAAAWITITLFWYAGALVWRWVASVHEAMTFGALGAAAAALATAFGKLQQILGREPNRATGGSALARVRQRLPQIIAYVVLAALVCGVVLLMIAAARQGWSGAVVATAAGVTLFVLLFFDPNEIGLHSFYRGRLARAYPGASNPNPAHTAELRVGDDVSLRDMARNRPLHLVCCAGNDLDSIDPIATLRRGAVSSVLSSAGFSIGSDAVCWSDVAPGMEVPSLATAITASGAAFNSQMGSKSIELGPAVTYLMATFNLRLGLWLTHPSSEAWRHYGWRSRAMRSSLPGLAFYRELFGRSRATAPRVHLSDGGHFENMALFELLRRHCRYIVASDCGADPDVAFDDFGNLVRRAREDLGIEIAIDLSPLRRDEKSGFARQQMVAGDIHYPNGDVGVLLLFKPTLTGDEPVDVRQYHDRNGDFPNESTGDQFYDEAQWEAYRRLGVHASRSAFRSVMDAIALMEDDLDGGDRAACVFAYARREWLPAPPDAHARISRLNARAAELDAALGTPEHEAVRREVYGEIAVLEGVGGAPAYRSSASIYSPTSDANTIAGALGIVREALLFMEEAFVCEELDRRGSHPLYLGLINYFSRWTGAPSVRAWWPVLRPMHSKAFAHYLERQFGITGHGGRGPYGAARVSDAVVDPKQPGAIAARARAAESSGAPIAAMGSSTPHHADGARRTLSFLVPLRPDSAQAPFEIQLGQVTVHASGGVLSWSAPEFYVAPSFWGAGIGESFLERLTTGEGVDGATDLLVRIPGARNGAGALKEGADLTQMYRAAGFKEVWPTPGGGWASGDGHIEITVDLEIDAESRWLWRRVGSRGQST